MEILYIQEVLNYYRDLQKKNTEYKYDFCDIRAGIRKNKFRLELLCMRIILSNYFLFLKQ